MLLYDRVNQGADQLSVNEVYFTHEVNKDQKPADLTAPKLGGVSKLARSRSRSRSRSRTLPIAARCPSP